MRDGNRGVKRVPIDTARHDSRLHEGDFLTPYVRALDQIIDLEVISTSGIRIGVDPLGGAAVRYWEPLADLWKLNLDVVNPTVDPTFAFMTCDHDGRSAWIVRVPSP
jgi:phosphoglucomutase